MLSQNLKYWQRWNMVFQNLAARRYEPQGRVGYYSNRSVNVFTRPNGTQFQLEARHHSVWTALVMHAHDLTQDSTHTWTGVETLSQHAGLTHDTFRILMADLEAVGLVRKTRRGPNQTNSIRIYLNPLDPDQEEPTVVNEVRVGAEDIGVYRCGAAEERSAKPKLEYPPDFSNLLDQMQILAPQHPSWGKRRVKQMHKQLLEAVNLAGNVHRTCKLVYHFLSEAPESGELQERLRKSEHLGAYLKSLIPEWLETYPHELPEVQTFDEDAS